MRTLFKSRLFPLLALCVSTLLALAVGQQEARRSPYTAVDRLEGVWIEMDPDTVTPAGGEIVLHNATSRPDFIYGMDYALEEKLWGRWYTVPRVPDVRISVPDIDLHIPTARQISAGFTEGVDYDPDSELSHKRYPPNRMGYFWELRYGSLPPGEYRLVIDVDSSRNAPIKRDYPCYYLTAPFTIP